MWTDIAREKHARKGLRYSSDLKDEEWAILEAMLPAPPRLGRPRKWTLRNIMDGAPYQLRSGAPWRMPPKDFPPVSTARRYFYEWRDTGLWGDINHKLLTDLRLKIGREGSPSAGVIDSQSVKTTESGGPSGYHAGKKIKGRKRHILTDTSGLLVGAFVHTADVQDRDGAPDLLASVRFRFPWLRHVFADGAYAGESWKRRCCGKVTGPSRSSSALMSPRVSSCCRADGSSSEPLLG